MSPIEWILVYAHCHFKWCDTLDIDSRSERGDKEMKFIDLFQVSEDFDLEWKVSDTSVLDFVRLINLLENLISHFSNRRRNRIS